MTDAGAAANAAGERARIEAQLDRLSRTFAERYGDDLSELRVTSSEGRVRVSGTVVVPRQLATLQRHVRDAGDGHVELDVAVLSELPDTDPRLPGTLLGPPAVPALPVYPRRIGGRLTTEWLADDGPARLLHEGTPRALVQLADATVGWCRLDGMARRPVGPDDIPVVRAMRPTEVIAAEPDSLAALVEAAGEVAATPPGAKPAAYRLGGRSLANGLDCSALVQHLVERHLGGLLPRHTTDQLKVGRRIPRSDIGPGDLVFARTADRNVMHVALAVADGEVVHACRLEGRVKREPLSGFFDHYRFLRAQRIIARRGA